MCRAAWIIGPAKGHASSVSALKHDVTFSGELARISGATTIRVNSLHGQGIDQLAAGLVVEAVAPDGTIEAVRVEGASSFAIAVQWHPEWEVTHFLDRKRLFEAFGQACDRIGAWSKNRGLTVASPGDKLSHSALESPSVWQKSFLYSVLPKGGALMDIQTIDNQYRQLQTQSQQTVQELRALAMKLQGAAQAGNQDAREWFLDLKSIALAIQSEQNQVANLLQALHNFMENQNRMSAAGPPGAISSRCSSRCPIRSRIMAVTRSSKRAAILGEFMNSGFGRAITMGAGFGIGDDLINSIF